MKVKRTHLQDPLLDRTVEDLRVPLNDLLSGVFANAQFLKESGSVELSFTSSVVKKLPHSLGQPYTGFLVVYSEGIFPTIDASTTVNTKKEIALVSSGTGTAKVIIF